MLTDQLSHLVLHAQPEAERRTFGAKASADDRIFFVGNTMIDTLVRMLPRAPQLGRPRRLRPRRGRLRPGHAAPAALVDGPASSTSSARLLGCPSVLPVVFPVHPRTRERRAPGLHDPSAAPARAASATSTSSRSRRARGGDHRFRRRAGGDDVSRRPVLHHARKHGAAGSRSPTARTSCSGSSPTRSKGCRICWSERGNEKASPNSPGGTAGQESGSPTSCSVISLPSRWRSGQPSGGHRPRGPASGSGSTSPIRRMSHCSRRSWTISGSKGTTSC